MYLPPQVIFHHIYIIVHHITSYYIVNLPKREEKVNCQQTRRNSEFLGKIGKNFPNAQCHFKAKFGCLTLQKIRPKIACWKDLLVYFLEQWNFWIWNPFAPSKIISPKTGSYGSKKWQRGQFLGVFCPLGDPDLLQIL